MQPEAMRVHAKATDRPDFAQILAHVRSLRPQIASRALAAEKAKRVPAETMDACATRLSSASCSRRVSAVTNMVRRSLRKSGSNLAAPAAAPGGAEHWPFASVG
jgi:hypothetical protein